MKKKRRPVLFERIHCACPSQKMDLRDPYPGEFSYLKTHIRTKIVGILKVTNTVLMTSLNWMKNQELFII